jgi:DNA methyltransferase 1-associated protein 1
MEEEENPSPPLETNYEFARFNVEVTVPTYTDEEYDAHLQNESWSREETDYLFEMAKEYFMRWAVIYDRYDFQPTKTEPPDDSSGGDNPTDALATLPYNSSSQRERTERSVEDLNARYYSVWETTLKLHRPPEAMESTEFELLEVLHRYNPDSEAARKRLALALMARTLDEVKEEEFLLAELQRINIAATRLDAERAELRERLEAPQPQRELPSGALANFQSSQALSALFAQLFQQDRSKKRASGSGRLSLSAGDIIGTPTAAQHAALAAAAGTRKASIAHGHSQPQQPQLRPMTAAEERRFGSSTHERLTSGISFGSDKLLKMRQAKSGVQTAKIGGILTELGFGEVITIPTARVGATFEGLVAKVSKLLDARKVREKEEAEAKVLEGMKARLKGENPAATNGESATNGRQSTETQERDMKQEDRDESMVDQSVADFAAVNASADDDGENDNDAEGEEDDADADGDEDADGETNATSTRQVSEAISTRAANTPAASVKAGQKRSASVLSETSNKSAKRTRK